MHPVPGITATAVRILVNSEYGYRYSVTRQEYNRRISAAFLLPRIAEPDAGAKDSLPQSAGRIVSSTGDVGDAGRFPVFRIPRNGLTGRPETLMGVRMDSAESRSIQHRSERGRICETAIDHVMFDASDSQSRFWHCARNFAHPRNSAHIFLLHPEAAQPIEPASAHVRPPTKRASPYTRCRFTGETGVAKSVRPTGGFYSISEICHEILQDSIGGLSHRYQASLTPDIEVRQVQVAVRTYGVRW